MPDYGCEGGQVTTCTSESGSAGIWGSVESGSTVAWAMGGSTATSFACEVGGSDSFTCDVGDASNLLVESGTPLETEEMAYILVES